MRTKTTLAFRLVTRVTRVTGVDSPKTLIMFGHELQIYRKEKEKKKPTHTPETVKNSLYQVM